MASNETLADIVEEMVEFGNHCAAFGGAYSPERWNNLCKRLIAAHKRAIAAKDAEIAELKARLEAVVNRIDKQICHPSESNCKRCGDHRGNCQCGSISNNEMMKLLNLAKGE